MITFEAWLTSRPDSTAASSEPGSEISSMMGSGDDVSDKLVICMSGPLAEDLVVQGNNGVSSIMADAHESLSSSGQSIFRSSKLAFRSGYAADSKAQYNLSWCNWAFRTCPVSLGHRSLAYHQRRARSLTCQHINMSTQPTATGLAAMQPAANVSSRLGRLAKPSLSLK